jgi:hypothetical protein
MLQNRDESIWIYSKRPLKVLQNKLQFNRKNIGNIYVFNIFHVQETHSEKITLKNYEA